MPWYSFLTDLIKKPQPTIEVKKPAEERKVLTFQEMMEELGLARTGILGSYGQEENPDILGPETYIMMQENDGEVQAIVRLLSLPIQSSPISILPAKGDKGERDFIETVFLGPEYMGGMTTPLPFLIADMTRAIFEGFRVYEKVPRIIEKGPYKGKIGWKKLAPRDAKTVKILADEHGGFNGIHQVATFGGKMVNVSIPPEKCVLFTFRKEKHWLYGESILRPAYYHYDKKHKLYYIAHKKAEIEALGLKILKVSQLITPAEREKAEQVVDTIGINSRITLPPGIELEINRETGRFDLMPLINHHNEEMAKSALCSVLENVKYAYPYGKRGLRQTDILSMALSGIMRQMEATLNTYAVAPLIDWNFGTNAYPEIRLMDITAEAKTILQEAFAAIARRKDIPLPEGFVDELVRKMAERMNLEWAQPKAEEVGPSKAREAFERGKIAAANRLRVKAPKTPDEIKKQLEQLENDPECEEKALNLGYDFVLKTQGVSLQPLK